MARVYFDSNVFSNLRTSEKEEYKSLKSKIEEYKENFSFFFSHAHIRDKKRDSSDYKYLDFEYMKSLAGDNYISYHGLEKITSFYLATPSQVFDDEKEENDFDFLSSFLNPEDGDEQEVLNIKASLKNVLSIPLLDIGSNLDDLLDEDSKKLYGKFFPFEKGSFTMFDFMEHLMNVSAKMTSEVNYYKELRSLINKKGDEIPHLQNDNSYNLKELFKDNEIQEKFVEYVKNSLHHKDKKKIPYYDFYLHSYATLDILGFKRDKLTKRNNYGNILNDSMHSYYARYCDYLVTDDKGLKEKSEILYKAYDVNTKILTVSEFLDVVDSIGRATDVNLIDFFNKLGSDLWSGELMSNRNEDGLKIYIIEPLNRYFNFFDLLEVYKPEKDGTFVFLAKKDIHYLSSPNFREKQQIVNRMVYMLGHDLGNKGEFEFDSEVEEIRAGTWQGRYWEIGDTKIYLHINEGTDKFCLQVGPFTRWLKVSHFNDEQRTEP